MTRSHSGYVIELIGFTDTPRDRAAKQLARAFGISRDKSSRLIDKAPVRVAKGVDRPQAERYVKALLSIGADVRVKGSGRERIYLAEAGVLQDVVWTGDYDSLEIPDTLSDRFEPPPRPSMPLPKPPTAPRPIADQVVCPKCGLEQPPSDTCARCGIVYEKFLKRRHTGHPTGEHQPMQSSFDVTPAAGIEALSSAEIPARSGRARAQLDPFVVSPDDDDRLFRQGRLFSSFVTCSGTTAHRPARWCRLAFRRLLAAQATPTQHPYRRWRSVGRRGGRPTKRAAAPMSASGTRSAGRSCLR